jgi:hypothetical protein
VHRCAAADDDFEHSLAGLTLEAEASSGAAVIELGDAMAPGNAFTGIRLAARISAIFS